MNRSDPAEKRRLALMRQASGRANSRFNIGGTVKHGGHKPKPITLATKPWSDDEQSEASLGSARSASVADD